MRARDIITHPVVVTGEATNLEDVARLMLDQRIGGFPVVSAERKLVGIITESDFTGIEACIPFSVYRVPQLFRQWIGSDGIEQLYRSGRKLTSRDVMRAPVVTASEDEPGTSAVKRMIEHDISRVRVVRDGVPVGIVARHDLLRLMLEPRPERAPDTI